METKQEKVSQPQLPAKPITQASNKQIQELITKPKTEAKRALPSKNM
jgi:hypothetical protein